MRVTDWEHLPPISGGAVDDPGAAPADAGGDQPPANDGGQTYEIDGETYTAEDIRAALDSHANRSQWEGTLKQKEMREAAVRRVLEGAFNKPIQELDDRDLADLAGFGSINQHLRTNPAFERAWTESLTQIYQNLGMRPRQATAAAERKVEQLKGGQPAEQPAPRDDAMARRLAALEEREIQRGLEAFGDRLDSNISQALQKIAPEFKTLQGHLRRVVLHGLSGYGDPELLEMERTGELNRLVWQLGREAAKMTKAEMDAYLKTSAATAATAAGGKPGSPPPLKGGPPPAAAPTEPEVRMGRGLKSFHERMRANFQVPTPSE